MKRRKNMAAKTKKEIILELKKQNPNLTPEEAAEAVPCTLSYAKRILEAEAALYNNEIIQIGREIGIGEKYLKEWYDWIIYSMRGENAKEIFRKYLECKKNIIME